MREGRREGQERGGRDREREREEEPDVRDSEATLTAYLEDH